jgi:hypothetical protein
LRPQGAFDWRSSSEENNGVSQPPTEYEDLLRQSLDSVVREADAYFMKEGPQEIIRARKLDETFAAQLDASVRTRFLALLADLRNADVD